MSLYEVLKLPPELCDNIILNYLSWSEIEKIRQIVSDYVNDCTKYPLFQKHISTNNARWLLYKYPEQSRNVTRRYFTQIVRNGNMNMIKLLYEHGCPWNASTSAAAARNGNLDNMKWLHEHGCPWNASTFCAAARNGNLDNMKWLHEHGCLWNIDTFACAAKNGNLVNMKWLREHGCPWNEMTFKTAVAQGNHDNIKWLFTYDCPFDLNMLGEMDVNRDIYDLIMEILGLDKIVIFDRRK